MNNIPNKGSFEQITSQTFLIANAPAEISLPTSNKPDVAQASSRAWLARGQFWLGWRKNGTQMTLIQLIAADQR